jgi:N-methylhydantoinase A
VAVSLLHSYADDSHERLLGELLGAMLPDVHVSLSSDLVGTFREFERTATTVLDAALSPLLGDYLERLCREAVEAGLPRPLVMQSSGGLTEAARAGAHAALTVLSGPAGGVGGALAVAALAQADQVLCFDMGGTSCDVCVIDGAEVAETAERTIAGRPLSLPAFDIHTVGAGGGSIAWRDAGDALRVGPASAGAVPGPACYGLGGLEPTVTDANLVLGRLLEDSPLAGGLQLDRAAAETAVARLAEDLDLDLLACAEGIVRVAEAEMLGAMRVMTLERGIDPRGFALMPFGGAGPLHAAALASELGIARVLCPRASGVLCALGLAAAPARRDVARTVILSDRALSSERLDRERSTLVAQATSMLAGPPARMRIRHELRYSGQAFELSVEETIEDGEEAGLLDPDGLCEAFTRVHEQRYGYRDESANIELVNIRVSVWDTAPALALHAGQAAEASTETGEVVFAGERMRCTVRRGEPAPGSRLEGPTLCALPDSTLLIPPGWSGTVDAHGTIHLDRESEG